MGACSSSEPRLGAEATAEKELDLDASTDVDLQLLNQQLRELFKFKILLLGAGESGKSTVVKQIKMIHKKKLSSKELEMVATGLHQNLVESLRALVQAVQNFGTHSLHDEEKKIHDMLMRHDENQRLTPDQGDDILRLWNSPAIQAAYQRRNEFWLLDSFPYYIKHCQRFCEEDFMPTEEDQVMARIRTTGIVLTNVESKIIKEDKDEPDSLQFQVVDVGGQRNERKKWMHCFDDVACILFIVNLAGYNQVLFEDNTKNRMEEELELFEKVTHNPIFADTPIFLFLNKKDLFEQMIKERDMRHIFSDYDGGLNLDPALEYIKDAFKKRLPPNKAVNIEVVTASYKRDIRYAFESVKHLLYRMKRKQCLTDVKRIRAQQRAIIAEKTKVRESACGCFSTSPQTQQSSTPQKYEEDDD